MQNLLRFSAILVLVSLLLAGCSSVPGPSVRNFTLSNVEIEVTRTACDVETNTTAKSCPGLGLNDPVDFACQLPSNSAQNRRIDWSSSDAFTIEFEDIDGDGTPDHPFVNLNGRCKVDTADTDFACLMRNKNASPPLLPLYKYTVKVGACVHDPRIFVMN